MTIHDRARENAQVALDETYSAYIAEEIARAVSSVTAERNAARAEATRLSGVLEETASALTLARGRISQLEQDLADCRAGHPDPDPDPDPGRAFPVLFGAAIDNKQTAINELQEAWGPIRMAREYEASKGVGAVTRYPWWSSVIRELADPTDDNFRYLAFSVDNPWEQTSSGSDKGQWEELLHSLTTHLPGVRGFVSLGNETNIEGPVDQRGALADRYRAASEKLIDTFGYEPVPGWCFGTSFSNHFSWGQDKTEGERWLPQRADGLFAVSTHIYGKDQYTDPALMIGRTFIPAMKRRPNWIWGIGETSAQEDAGHTKKAAWLTACFDLVEREGGSWYLPFDTNVGGSADVGSSPQSAAAVRRLAQRAARNNWTY